ncbi:chromosome partitioning protein ParA, partial [Pseudomonas syringae pv. actinidiae]
DGVNLAVERFELEHPTIAGTLRNIVQTLGNIGV